jgi:hypothetical protein
MRIESIADYFQPAKTNELINRIDPQFEKYKREIILAMIKGREAHEQRENIYDAITDHRTKFHNHELKSDVLLLVHPFFLGICHFELQTCKSKVIKTLEKYSIILMKYLNRVEKVIRQINKDKYSVVVMEIPEHYPMGTCTLLEQKDIDNVVFTETGLGYPRRLDEGLDLSREVEYYLGGSFAFRCVKDAAVYLKDRRADFTIVPELLLAAPFPRDGDEDGRSLISKQPRVSLDKLLGKQ